MGIINDDPNYSHKIKYEESGALAVFIVCHLVKYGKITEISLP
jgi:hypothetical protein